MLKLTVFYPAIPSEDGIDVLVLAMDHGEDDQDGDVSTNLTDAEPLVNQEIGGLEGLLSVDASDDESGTLSIAYDPDVAPWSEWYLDAANGIEIYYKHTYGRKFNIEYHTQPSDQL